MYSNLYASPSQPGEVLKLFFNLIKTKRNLNNQAIQCLFKKKKKYL